ncbi:unnamed protein product, partial [Oppiella nova]
MKAMADQEVNEGVGDGDQMDANPPASGSNSNGPPTAHSPTHGVLHIHEDSIDYDMRHKNFGKCIILNHEFFKRSDVCPP